MLNVFWPPTWRLPICRYALLLAPYAPKYPFEPLDGVGASWRAVGQPGCMAASGAWLPWLPWLPACLPASLPAWRPGEPGGWGKKRKTGGDRGTLGSRVHDRATPFGHAGPRSLCDGMHLTRFRCSSLGSRPAETTRTHHTHHPIGSPQPSPGLVRIGLQVLLVVLPSRCRMTRCGATRV